MTEHSDKWWTSMIKRHGSREAVTEFMAKSAQKAKYGKPRGFAYDKAHGNDERIKEMSKKALEKRWGQGGKETKRSTVKEEG